MDRCALRGKRILLGVSGSIAAYKAVDILRRLGEEGAEVRVVLTRNAARFVTALTFSALSGRPVLTDEFSDGGWGPMGHIAVSDGLDLLVVAPATANIIAKMAAGIADDALSTVLVAAACPIIVAPAMNDRMYRNPVLRRNVDVLRASGVRFVEPGTGALACGVEGQGRLAETEGIMGEVRAALCPSGALAGTRVLVTSGPTREPIDAVRFLSNPSSGRMGYAIAAAARDRGAAVVLVSGPTSLAAPPGVRLIPVMTASEMRAAVLEQARTAQVVIMAAAVSDFRPAEPAVGKIKKSEASLVLQLEPTEDILLSLGRDKGGRILVGFAAETDDVLRNAREKLERKNLDLVVANDIGMPGAGFGTLTNAVTLIDRSGATSEIPLTSKAAVAEAILDRVEELKTNQGL